MPDELHVSSAGHLSTVDWFVFVLVNCKQSELRKFCKVVDMQQSEVDSPCS